MFLKQPIHGTQGGVRGSRFHYDKRRPWSLIAAILATNDNRMQNLAGWLYLIHSACVYMVRILAGACWTSLNSNHLWPALHNSLPTLPYLLYSEGWGERFQLEAYNPKANSLYKLFVYKCINWKNTIKLIQNHFSIFKIRAIRQNWTEK